MTNITVYDVDAEEINKIAAHETPEKRRKSIRGCTVYPVPKPAENGRSEGHRLRTRRAVDPCSVSAGIRHRPIP